MSSLFNLFAVAVRKNIFSRRLIYSIFTLAMLATGFNALIAQQGNITTKDSRSANAVAEARKSLGGEKVDNIKSLILKGNEKRSVFTSTEPNKGYSSMKKTGEQLLEFEIRVLFPDNLIMISRYPTENSNGYFDTSNNSSVGTNILRGILLGMIMKSVNMPLTISAGSTNEFTVESKDGLFGVMKFDTNGKWPSSIEHTYKGSTPVLTKLPNGKTRLSWEPSSEERAFIQFSDRFSVEGVMFPKIIRSTMEGTLDRTLEITNVKINPQLTQKDFDFPVGQ